MRNRETLIADEAQCFSQLSTPQLFAILAILLTDMREIRLRSNSIILANSLSYNYLYVPVLADSTLVRLLPNSIPCKFSSSDGECIRTRGIAVAFLFVVKRVCDKTKQTSAHILCHMKDIILVSDKKNG